MRIHREGPKLLIIFFILILSINIAFFGLLPEYPVVNYIILTASLVSYAFYFQFFRDPERSIELNDNHIIAPADGKIVVIEEVEEPEYFNNEPRRQISIFMSPMNVHVNRNPVSGILKYFKYHPGLYLVAWHPKSSTLNERTTLVYETKNGQEILIRQIAGAMAKRIRWYVKPNDTLKQGDRFGFITFGSRVDVFVPLDVKINVEIDQKSVGGKTVLATFE